MATVRFAVMGCGRWGPNHIRSLDGLPGARLVARADTNRAALARIAQRFPAIAGKSAAAALRDPGIDAVVVLTPANNHYALARRALLAGKRVLCERPLRRASRQAESRVALARWKKRVLMVGHIFLFTNGVLRLKKLVDSSRLGRIRSLSAMRLMNEDPLWVTATGCAIPRAGVDNESFLTLYYPGGVRARLHAGRLCAEKVRRLTVVGASRAGSWDERNAKSADEEPLKIRAPAFLRALRAETPDRSAPEFSAGVVRVLEAAEISVKQRGRPVEVHR